MKNYVFFDTFFDLLKKKFFWVKVVLFSKFEAKRAKNGSKNGKPFL
jgi:hypothetical protein